MFDDNSTFRFRARRLLTSGRDAQLQFHANARLFSAVARRGLPDIDFNVTARYLPDLLRLDGTLLGGTLGAEMNLTTFGYRYRIRSLRLERLLHALELPRYAAGPLSAEGNGSAVAPYPQHADIISDNITRRAADCPNRPEAGTSALGHRKHCGHFQQRPSSQRPLLPDLPCTQSNRRTDHLRS